MSKKQSVKVSFKVKGFLSFEMTCTGQNIFYKCSSVNSKGCGHAGTLPDGFSFKYIPQRNILLIVDDNFRYFRVRKFSDLFVVKPVMKDWFNIRLRPDFESHLSKKLKLAKFA